MRSKLVLVFDDGDEVNGIPNPLIFNNVLDAERYLIDTGRVQSVKIEPDDKYFSFSASPWKGSGKAYWAIEPF